MLGQEDKYLKKYEDILLDLSNIEEEDYIEERVPIAFVDDKEEIYIDDKFPQPLSEQVEKYYLQLKENGDIEARKELIEHNLRLVACIARKYKKDYNFYITLNDLINIGVIGLIKGVDRFDSSKNDKLSSYTSRCIENEIYMYFRRTIYLKNEVSLDMPIAYDEYGNELHVEDLLCIDSDPVGKSVERQIERKLLMEEVKKLKGRDRKIIILRYGREMTQKAVGEILGIDYTWVSKLEKGIIKEMRRNISR